MNTPTQVTYRAVTDRQITGFRRYRVGMIVSFLPDSISPSVDKARLRAELDPYWTTIELLAPTGDVTGSIQSWIMQAFSRSDFALKDTPMVSYGAIAEEVVPTVPTSPEPVVAPTAPAAVPDVVQTGPSGGSLLATFLVGAAALGVIWWVASRVEVPAVVR